LIDILYNHSDFLVVNKPFGVGIHCEPQQDKSASEGIIAKLQKQLDIPQLYPVHRLDKVTTGLLLVAKNAAAAGALSLLFQNKQINKYYLAVSDQKPKKKQGSVSGEMCPARRGSWKLIPKAKSGSNANIARTQFFSHSIGDGKRLFLVKPLSGKTHQIRVMMKSLSSPILGDKRYSGSDADRCYLHAYWLSFSYSNKRFSFLMPPSSGEDFLNDTVTEQLSREWAHPNSLNWPK
jgi:tRNA pseudouridine32 synthase/23S rRNA pseudouridine746 synthase